MRIEWMFLAREVEERSPGFIEARGVGANWTLSAAPMPLVYAVIAILTSWEDVDQEVTWWVRVYDETETEYLTERTGSLTVPIPDTETVHPDGTFRSVVHVPVPVPDADRWYKVRAHFGTEADAQWLRVMDLPALKVKRPEG